MVAHRFAAGQKVTMVPRRLAATPKGSFQIVRLLPAERGVNQYRIRSLADGHERVVLEDEVA
jgi:hypothetical protein